MEEKVLIKSEQYNLKRCMKKINEILKGIRNE